MSNFEKRFGKYAIKNISLILLLCYGIGYVIEAVNSSFLLYLTLNPYAILHGEVWRLFTWILIPPSSLGGSMGIFFVCIMLLFYYNIGTTLEHTWGTYRYNVYLLSGMLFTVAGSFVWMIILGLCTHVVQCRGGQKRVLGSPGTGVLLELELQMVLSCHVGAGD